MVRSGQGWPPPLIPPRRVAKHAETGKPQSAARALPGVGEVPRPVPHVALAYAVHPRVVARSLETGQHGARAW